MRAARALRWAAYVAAGLVVLAVAALLILPKFLDAPAVEAEIQRRVSAAVGGEFGWKDLEVKIFPLPHAALHEVRLEIPGSVSARVEQADVYLQLWPLFRGS